MRFGTHVMGILMTLCTVSLALDGEEQVTRYRENFVIPVSIEALELESFEVFPGDALYVEIAYLAHPGGQVLFIEPAEQVWWVQEESLLLLGSTGLPLPFEVFKRKQVFIQVYIAGDPLYTSAQKVLPRRDGFEVDADVSSLKQKLRSRLVGVDAPYLSQVANYLAMNLASLEVKGETLTIDTDGWFGGTVETAGFRMTPGASAGRVLSCDANGEASWQDPAGGGLSLPYSGSGSEAGALFSLTQSGTGNTMELTSNNASNVMPCLTTQSNNLAPAINAENTFQAVAINNGNAATFVTPNPNSGAATLYAESNSDANGVAIAGSQKGQDGNAAHFINDDAGNTSDTISASTYGSGSVINAINYHPSSGTVARFKMDKSSNSGNVVEASTGGAGIVFDAQNTGTGKVAELTIGNASSPATALDVVTSGLGHAGHFEGTNTAGTQAVVKSTSNHDGAALHVVNTSNSSSADYGHAAIFECTETSPFSLNKAIAAKNAGGGDCIFAESTGAGIPGRFVNTNSTLSLEALVAINDSAVAGTIKAINHNASGSAGIFWGDVAVNGTLSKTAGSFRIDHPLDPEHKYLQHSFVESPDMMNIYNGLVTLDGQGEAWVTLPDWFQALNRSFRYQLTAIGQPAPNLYIARKINGLKFKIAGGQPHQEVSWQVTGIRQDKYAQDHPIQTELDKPADAIGKYIYPQGYGADRSDGIGYAELRRPRER